MSSVGSEARHRVAAVLLALTVSSAAACSAVLGIGDVPEPADAASDGTSDSPHDSTADIASDSPSEPAPEASDASDAGDGGCSPACGDAAPVCLNGQCVACQPGAQYCDDAGSAQQCSEAGAWTVQACADAAQPVCLGGACVACEPGAIQCAGDGAVSEWCGDAGSWQADGGGACPSGDPVCLGSACVQCWPGALACQVDSGAKQSCDDAGGWEDAGSCCCTSNACADLSTDTNNCGMCGHDCLGATCSGGLCAPGTLAKSEGNPGGFAVDDDYAYWGSGWSALRYAPLNVDGGAGNLPSPGNCLFMAVAVDSQNLYWSCRGTNPLLIQSQPKGGGPIATVASGTTCACPSAFYPDSLGPASGYVYFTNGSNGGSISRIPTTADGGAGVALDHSPGNEAPGGVAHVDSQYVWWATNSSVLRKTPIAGLPDGGASTVIVSNIPQGAALDQNSVYWGLPGGTIWSANSADGSGAKQILGGQNGAGVFGADGAHIYWTTADGRIWRANVDGSGVLLLADLGWGDAGSQWVAAAIDSKWVVCWSGNPGPIQKVAK